MWKWPEGTAPNDSGSPQPKPDAKFMILGEMPQCASPERFFAAGPWCFADREDNFPHWEKRFDFAPEPLADSGAIAQAAKQAQALCMAAMPFIAKALDPVPERLTAIYWQTLLAPWAIAASSQIVERWLRVKAMIQKWGEDSLHVPLLVEADFNFADETDFNLRGALGKNYNWHLFSCLLQLDWPAKWTPLPGKLLPAATEKPLPSASVRVRHFLKNLLLRLPFPPVKGLGLFRSLLFSLALCHKTKIPAAKSREELFANKDLLATLPPLEKLLPLFLECLPASLKKLDHSRKPIARNNPRLKAASISAYENSPYRQRLARWKAAGGRIACAQHGGNYGQAKVVCNSAFVEYAEDLFFTWGWRRHGSLWGNFLPMPWPQLQGIRASWRKQNDNILFVGTEMACYAYRLESRPTPLQFIQYREDKARFLETLPDNLCKRILYRPYFPVPGTLADWPWLTQRFPEIGLCEGPLMTSLKHCSLLVIDHPGTTMLEAFAANIPTLLYWRPEQWPLTAESEELLGELEQAGIWHASPEAAAAKIPEIIANTPGWLQSAPVANAVANYCKFQASTIKSGFLKHWLSTLWNL